MTTFKNRDSYGTATSEMVSTEILYADTKTGKLAYRSSGSGDPMILCSRFRGNLDSWDPAFIAALAKNYTVITFDYVGFGSSTGTPVTTVLSFVENVRDLAQALGLEKIIVGGWSLGGFVAMIAMTEIPVLVISADHEVWFPPENWFELNRKMPTTQVVVIPQSGHGVHHQYPEMVVAYIDTFL